ncbi:hypothetical protein [Nocardioides abyssi]|uniref:Uncharacterized protein n=1 Tax=Nocardioides abyssi TaxID=3058370 RepID=A0ABT8ESF9_9ACTN|nr:hypothetical protein [Nocardioides abyssi]MDN4161080.1 hypothetical protein [Nocardioides abyssi]
MTAHRPLFQGDVFRDVPFTKARSAGNPDRDPNVVIERRMVALLGYPCDIYNDGRLVKVQTVAPVVDATKMGIPPDWDGAFTLAPLPDLLGDGNTYAVDLRTAANIDASYLTTDRRVRALSEDGWALFRQRTILCDTRAMIELAPLRDFGSPLWAEIELWQEWNEAGQDPAAFQPWLDTHDPHFGGFTRRSALERRLSGQVRNLMRLAL